jgi:protein-disulfide isomerase
MATPSSAPAGTTPEGDGIAVGDGPVRVDAYEDFFCPYCRKFEQRSGPALDRLLADGRITLVYHPVAFLDRFSQGTRYATRAVAAAGAAAAAGGYVAFKDALFAQQPEEGTPGLTDDQFVALGREAGISSAEFADDVLSGRWLAWSEQVSERAAELGVNGIPTVLVAGEQVQPDGEEIAAAVERAQG